MKKIIFFFFVIGILFACKTKGNHKPVDIIDANQLVAIIHDNNFLNFERIVKKTKYDSYDSSITFDNKIIYVAEDTSETGNSLSVTMTKDHLIDFLHFSTYDKDLYIRLKQQLNQMGYKSTKFKNNMEDFEMGNIFVSTVIADRESPASYEFMFVSKK